MQVFARLNQQNIGSASRLSRMGTPWPAADPVAPARTSTAAHPPTSPEGRKASSKPPEYVGSHLGRSHHASGVPQGHVSFSGRRASGEKQCARTGTPESAPSNPSQRSYDAILSALQSMEASDAGGANAINLRKRLEAIAPQLVAAARMTSPSPSGAAAAAVSRSTSALAAAISSPRAAPPAASHRNGSTTPPLGGPTTVHGAALMAALTQRVRQEQIASAAHAASAASPMAQLHSRGPTVPAYAASAPMFASPRSVGHAHAPRARTSAPAHSPNSAQPASTPPRVPQGMHTPSLVSQQPRPSTTPTLGQSIEQALARLAQVAAHRSASGAPQPAHPVVSPPSQPGTPASQPQAGANAQSPLVATLLQAARQGLLSESMQAALVEQLRATVAGQRPQDSPEAAMHLMHAPVIAVRGGAGGSSRAFGSAEPLPQSGEARAVGRLVERCSPAHAAPAVGRKRLFTEVGGGGGPVKSARAVSAGKRAAAAALGLAAGGSQGASAPVRPADGLPSHSKPAQADVPSQELMHALNSALAGGVLPGRGHMAGVAATSARGRAGRPSGNASPPPPMNRASQPRPCASSSSSDVVMVLGPTKPLGTASAAQAEAAAAAADSISLANVLGSLPSPPPPRADPMAMVDAVMVEFAKVPTSVLEKLQRFGVTELEHMCNELRNIMADGHTRGHTWTAAELEDEALRVYKGHCAKMGCDPHGGVPIAERGSSKPTATAGGGKAGPSRGGTLPSLAAAAPSEQQRAAAQWEPAEGAAAVPKEQARVDRETMAAAQTLAAMGVAPVGAAAANGRHAGVVPRTAVVHVGDRGPGGDAALRTPEKAKGGRSVSDADVDEDAALTQTLEALLEAKSTPVPPRAQGAEGWVPCAVPRPTPVFVDCCPFARFALLLSSSGSAPELLPCKRGSPTRNHRPLVECSVGRGHA